MKEQSNLSSDQRNQSSQTITEPVDPDNNPTIDQNPSLEVEDYYGRL